MNMRRGLFLSLLICFCTSASFADALDLNTALQNTYKACVDIDDNLHDLKVLAGVNTAVTAVGTGLGVGATVTGFVKASKDNQAQEVAKKINYNERPVNVFPTNEEMDAFEAAFNSEEMRRLYDELREDSKKLGDWRTGLLAGNTVTNVAGAVIASRTINKDDIQGQVDACVSATKDLNNAIIAAKMNGEDINEAKQIYDACREYEFVDLKPINKRGTGAMISSAIGAGLGGAGTVVSGVANSEAIRQDNKDISEKTDSDWKKEKDLNTAANALSVGATAASATAVVFNATQIAAVKKVAKVSESCTGVLK